ncbi:MAG: universal stress protein [Terrimesophilobacter sp.]
MVEKIVVALDGSAPSESALHWAMERAGRTDASVTLVTVVPDTVATLVPGLPERLAVTARSFIDNARERAQRLAPDVDVAAKVSHGSVLSALSSPAYDADLLVIGTHKHGVIVGAIHGTLSLRLAVAISCSIAVIPETLPAGRHIVVGVDGSDEALFACEVAAAQAIATDSVLLLVCAGYVTNPLFTSLVPPEIASRDHAAVLARAKAHVLERFPKARVQTESIYGSPADALIEASRSARLLVLGHHKRSRLQRLMGGSVHSQVLLDMSIPVLLARRPTATAAVPDTPKIDERPREPHTGARTVVGWSGSAASENALHWAVRHQMPHSGRVAIVRVVDDAVLVLHASDSDRVVVAARMELGDRVSQLRQENPGLTVDALLLCGDPYDELRRLSDPSALVVVGAELQQSSSRNAWSMGVRLAGNADGPIAIVPQGDDEFHNVVVVGIDGSAASAAAARLAARDAAAHGSELHLVQAWQQPAAWQDLRAPADDDFTRSLAQAHEHILDEAEAQVRAAYPELRIRPDLVHGAPAEALLEAGESARMLVVGNRGHRTTMRFLLGSVSHTVALNIHSPIIIVPSDAQENQE